MMTWGWVGLAACATLGVTAPMAAQDVFFEEANRHYQAGDYEAALSSYLRILESGVESAALHYNIGNSYFKLGDLGRSILSYERALRLDRRDDDARANLALAHALTADEITPLPGFWVFRVVDWWVHLLPRTWLARVVALAYLCCAVGLVAAILGGRSWTDRWGRRLVAVGAAVVLVFGLNLAAIECAWGQPVEAIVLSPEVPVQSAPSEDQTLQLFTIHEGTKVRVDQDAGEWAEIVLADGKVGWVKVESLGVI